MADDDFERRITLRGDDGELVTLIVGDSPGFRRLFARVAGEDAVYDLRLALTDLSADSDGWIDRGDSSSIAARSSAFPVPIGF